MRRAARIDANQNEIVSTLRTIPGVTIAPGHDDILVGFRGKTWWFELKNPSALKKTGELGKGELKESQRKLLENWTGHYSVVWDIDQILNEIGITE